MCLVVAISLKEFIAELDSYWITFVHWIGDIDDFVEVIEDERNLTRFFVLS